MSLGSGGRRASPGCLQISEQISASACGWWIRGLEPRVLSCAVHTGTAPHPDLACSATAAPAPTPTRAGGRGGWAAARAASRGSLHALPRTSRGSLCRASWSAQSQRSEPTAALLTWAGWLARLPRLPTRGACLAGRLGCGKALKPMCSIMASVDVAAAVAGSSRRARSRSGRSGRWSAAGASWVGCGAACAGAVGRPSCAPQHACLVTAAAVAAGCAAREPAAGVAQHPPVSWLLPPTLTWFNLHGVCWCRERERPVEDGRRDRERRTSEGRGDRDRCVPPFPLQGAPPCQPASCWIPAHSCPGWLAAAAAGARRPSLSHRPIPVLPPSSASRLVSHLPCTPLPCTPLPVPVPLPVQVGSGAGGAASGLRPGSQAGAGGPRRARVLRSRQRRKAAPRARPVRTGCHPRAPWWRVAGQ